jgi:hypothetical protein
LWVRRYYEIQIILRKNNKRLVGVSHQVCDCMHPSLRDCGFALVINYLGIWLMNWSDRELELMVQSLETEIDFRESTYKAKDRLCLPSLMKLYYKIQQIRVRRFNAESTR